MEKKAEEERLKAEAEAEAKKKAEEAERVRVDFYWTFVIFEDIDKFMLVKRMHNTIFQCIEHKNQRYCVPHAGLDAVIQGVIGDAQD